MCCSALRLIWARPTKVDPRQLAPKMVFEVIKRRVTYEARINSKPQNLKTSKPQNLKTSKPENRGIENEAIHRHCSFETRVLPRERTRALRKSGASTQLLMPLGTTEVLPPLWLSGAPYRAWYKLQNAFAICSCWIKPEATRGTYTTYDLLEPKRYTSTCF